MLEGLTFQRLMALADRTGFRASTIEVMDGSKRSGHSNAFFTGFGRYRRIVLYDTLVSQLSPEELEAVLGYEKHNKNRETLLYEIQRKIGVPIEGYDELNVGEISGRLDSLSEEELKKVRDYEKRNKNRDTLIEQLDRKIGADS
jgi:hypothetical protein